MFVGRKKELETLDNRFKSDDLEVGVVYGQRRIGKTYLILESVKDLEYIYFLSKNTSYADNLRYFSSEYRKFLNLPYPVEFESFDDLFNSIKNEAKNRKIVLIIDELPFLASVYPGIISFMQGYIDSLKREEINMKIIFSGSNISFFVDLLSNKAKPLYQRITFKIHVTPMLFSDASKMLDGHSSEDKIKYLSIFGNRPYYLEKIKKTKTFDQNIIDLCFSSESIMIDAPNITLPIGYANNGTYISILGAIANRKHKQKEIADELHIESNALATFLKRMVDSESIERRETFNGTNRTNYYEIADPLIRFYYKLIYPNYENIQRGLSEDIYSINKNVVEEVVAHGFEDVVNSFMDELNMKHKLDSSFEPFQKYVADNSILGRSIEIDGLAKSLDSKHLLAIEAKFRNKNVSLDVLKHLEESVSIFSKQYKHIEYYLFSKTSFADELSNLKRDDVKLISVDDMFLILEH